MKQIWMNFGESEIQYDEAEKAEILWSEYPGIKELFYYLF